VSFLGATSLFIIPGYNFKIINGLITNFHLPKSTLLLLIASFAGKDFYRKIYAEALINDYRFLSYGDSSIIFK
jgi:S-adenosylmethionine:tRNA ribosyltransferase-isomerase